MKIASIVWQDYNGLTRQTIVRSINGVTAGGGASILATLQPLGWGEILYFFEGDIQGPLGIAAANPYQSVRDAASLEFVTTGAQIVRLTLPTPILSGGGVPTGLFLPDQTTIDLGFPGLAPLIAACIGNLCTPGANPVTAIVSGTMQPSRNDLAPIG